jgi:hypothetical protein
MRFNNLSLFWRVSQPFVAGLLLPIETVRDFHLSLVWRGNLQR